MDSFFARFKNSLVHMALGPIQTIALAVQVQRPTTVPAAQAGAQPASQSTSHPDSRRVTVLRYWIVAIVTPFERVFHGGGLRVRNLWSNYVDLRHTRQQNHDLQLEVARLRQEQAAFAEDAQQGRRLQAMLDFRQTYIASTVAAQIIGSSGSDRSRMVIIDKGYKEGLKSDQAVITPDGIVGKLRDVFPHTAQLLLINDPTSGAGVILESSRIRAVVHGGPSGAVQITNLTEDSRIHPGERILTSGGDQVFPRGLPVGVIQSIVRDPDHQPYTAITLKPAADLARLEEVLVVTGTQANLSAQAEADLNLAETTAGNMKRAAQLAAERLPSATDPTAPAAPTTAPGGVPGIPNSAAPHPQPALHPDHFSPGTTPPADQLTPGARQPQAQPAPSPGPPTTNN